MPGLPQLIEEDVRELEAALDELLERSEAGAALLIDKGGPLIGQRGAAGRFDATTVAALAAGAFSATETMARHLGETSLSHIYQQGRQVSLLISNVDENLLVIVVFPAALGVGAVKYYAGDAVARIAAQMQKAAQRAPGASLDLVSLNTVDVSQVFRKRE
ncbi:MAG TPA: roadblock/LC7 domain-containing protein [Candidatus Acidoferrum sp.]|nr:roadblock/LC7 domain-containing protein [Candidatus Acidoferrum sp.]